MAKRRRCKDKLPHLAHEWRDMPGPLIRRGSSGAGGRGKSTVINREHWCVGVNKEVGSGVS